MGLGPKEKCLRFSELSENRALKSFAHFCVQPAAPGLTTHKHIFIYQKLFKDKKNYFFTFQFCTYIGQSSKIRSFFVELKK